ncbi:MAG: phage portal protein [Candidatus Pristimantibacillus sp.]
MIEILLTRPDGTYLLPVERVEWKGAKYRAPRSIQVELISSSKGLHRPVIMDEGDAVMFRWKGIELFRGIVFSRSFSMDDRMTFTAYDNLYYLVNNTDSQVFTNQKASDMLKRLCQEFQVQMGNIADTQFVKKKQINEDDTPYEMVLMALDTTYKQLGTRYTIRSRQGKVELQANTKNIHNWIIEKGVNLTGYNYSTSIEETVTRVKMRSGSEEKTITVQADNAAAQKKYGILQLLETVSEDLNKAQLQQRANQTLSNKGKVNKSFSIESIGITDAVSGAGIHVIIPERGIKKGYYIEEDTHTFEAHDYTMSLTLSETDDLPEIDEDIDISNGTSKKKEDTFAEDLREEIRG